mgnify:CR=1 FL=1
MCYVTFGLIYFAHYDSVGGMARNYRKEYDNYHKRPEQKKRRAARNKARRKMTLLGSVSKGDGRDVHHKDGNPKNNSRSNLSAQSKSKNRSFARTKSARKR